MDDLISRKLAIEAVCRGCSGDYYQECQAYHGRKTFCDQIKRLRAVPSAQPEDKCGECDAWNQYKNYPEQRWIPVSERLPEDGKYVLAYSADDDFMTVEPRHKFEAFQITHWMPLPEPFK